MSDESAFLIVLYICVSIGLGFVFERWEDCVLWPYIVLLKISKRAISLLK